MAFPSWLDSIDGPLELNDYKFSMVETILQEVSPIHCANASHLGPFRSGKGPRETERPINLVLQSHSIKDSMSLVLVVRRKGSPQGWLHGVVWWCYLIPPETCLTRAVAREFPTRGDTKPTRYASSKAGTNTQTA